MKFRIAVALLIAGLASAHAQSTPPPPYTGVFPPTSRAGQEASGINANAFYANASAAGFGDSSLSSMVAAGTTQADAAIISTSTVILTDCQVGTGVRLPTIQRPGKIRIYNRASAPCLIYPHLGGTLELYPGNPGNPGDAYGMGGGDVTFQLVSPTMWFLSLNND